MEPRPELKARWEAWEARQYPRTGYESAVAHDDLALADGDFAAGFADYFGTPLFGAGPKQRPSTDFRVLRAVVADVDTRLPSLREPARSYFEEAVAIAHAILLEDREPPARY